MSKFKVGDRVRVTNSDYHRKASNVGRAFIIDRSEGTSDGEATWSGGQDSACAPYRWKESELELVSSAGPVRTVTRKEIVPGVYGRVGIGHLQDGGYPSACEITIRLNGDVFSKTELRAAAATFQELADALDEVA